MTQVLSKRLKCLKNLPIKLINIFMNKEKLSKFLNKLPNGRLLFAVLSGIILALILYLAFLLLPLR